MQLYSIDGDFFYDHSWLFALHFAININLSFMYCCISCTVSIVSGVNLRHAVFSFTQPLSLSLYTDQPMITGDAVIGDGYGFLPTELNMLKRKRRQEDVSSMAVCHSPADGPLCREI